MGDLNLQPAVAADPDEFRVVADAMPQLVWTADASGAVTFLNRRWLEYTGVKLHQLNNGRPPDVVHPEDLDRTWARWTAALAAGTPYEVEYRLRSAQDGAYRWFLGRAIPQRNEDGAIVRWVGTATDIDSQRRLSDSLSLIVSADGVLSGASGVPAICAALTEVVIEQFADWCFVVMERDGRLQTVAIAHKNRDLLRYVEQFRDRYPIRSDDSIGRVIADNEPYLIEQATPELISAAARDADHLELLQRLDIRSAMMLPMATPDGRVQGALGMIASESGRRFTRADLHVAEAVAARAASALGKARTLEQERRAARNLRVTAHVNQVLLDTEDVAAAIERAAETIATEVADACGVVRLDGNAVRTAFVLHRDPDSNGAVAELRGQRVLRPQAEEELAERLSRHRPIVQTAADVAAPWPHLARAVRAIGSGTAVTMPLFWGTTTYGGLTAYFTTRRYEAERDLPLLEEIAARISVAIEKWETLRRERRISTTLQRALLPTLIPQPEGLRLSSVYSPASGEGEIGGDWYDAIELDDGSLVVSVGDVTGRGVKAAAIMSKVRHAMGMAPKHETDPAKILDAAEWFLRKRYPDAIVTAFVGVIDRKRRTLRYATAGHPGGILRRDGEAQELQAEGLPIGLRHLAAPTSCEREALRDGDVLVLYTDGLTEWSRSSPEGDRCLAKIVKSEAIAVTQNPAALIERSCVPDGSPDDVAILTVSIGNAPRWYYAAEDARVAAQARREFIEFLGEHVSDDAYLARSELIFGELLGNVVRHAPGPVETSLYYRRGRWELHVLDCGETFEAQPGLPADPLSELGRGLFIVQQLAANVRVEAFSGGNHIIATL